MVTFRVIKQLATPVAYLSVKGDGKRVIDISVPLLLTLLSVPLLLALPASMLGADGLVRQVNELLQVLVGFYVASVAAVSSIPGAALDQDVKHAKLGGESLSRRQFLSLLFGYLSMIGLLLYVLGVTAILAREVLHNFSSWSQVVYVVLVASYVFVCWHMVCVTFLALRYLIDKAYKPDPIAARVESAPAEKEDLD